MKNEFFNLQKYKKIGEFELSSGKRTRIYWDFRPLLVNYKDLKLLMDFYFDRLWNGMDTKKRGLNVIGIEFWGAVLVPMINFLSSNPKVNYNPLILRKEKKYGSKDRLLGTLDQKLQTVLIDDLVFTADTLTNAIEYLKEKEIKIDKILVLINNGNVNEINSIQIDSVFKIPKH